MSIKKYLANLKKYRFNSVFAKNLVMITSVILIPCIIFCVISFIITKKAVESEIGANIANRTEVANSSVEQFVQTIDKMMLVLTQKNECKKIMSISESSTNLNEEYMQLGELFDDYCLVNRYIKNVSIYSEINNRLFGTSNKINCMNEDGRVWLREYKQSDDMFLIFTADKGADNVIFMRKYSVGKKTLGAIFFEISIEEMFNRLNINTADSKEKIMLIDDNSNIILSSCAADIGSNAEKFLDAPGRTDLSTSACDHLRRIGLRCIYVFDDMHVSEKNLVIALGVLLIFMSALCVSIAVYISVKTYKPLLDILKIINVGDTKLRKATNEVEYILNNIIDINKKNPKLSKKMEEMTNAYIKALQSQMNPHFLCNVLESIKWMAISEETDNNQLNYIIESLYDFLKYSMELDRYMVDINEEIKNTKTYIEILELRYEGRFDVNWSIASELENSHVLKMSIQPMIENAIKHGVLQKRGKSIVNVSIYKDGGAICIEVEDNGIGITEDKLTDIHAVLDGTEQKISIGIGLKNLNLRAKLIYGEEYGISITSVYGKGTKTTLKLGVM